MAVDYNQKVFERPGVVQYYTHETDLTPAEAAIFEQVRNSRAGRHVLDLGVGGGRTTRWLAPPSAAYVGVDYSRAMVGRCRERFPQYRFEHGDARDLSRFKAGQFDFVLFSFNGIDMVDHAGRLKVLAEVGRVLVPGGVFAFSSHSLERAATCSVWRHIWRMEAPAGPLRAVRRLARTGLRLGNYARRRHLQVRGDDHAILLDPGHDFIMPIYYVNPTEQRKQLREAGFDPDTQLLPEYGPDDPAGDQRPYSIYYVTRRL